MCDSYGQECEILMLIKSLRISLPVFWTSNRPKAFHKAFEDTIAILQRTNIQLILYLDDIIWMRRTSEEILLHRDNLIFLLEKFGFMINRKNSIFELAQQLQILGLIIITETILFVTKEKLVFDRRKIGKSDNKM